MQKYQQEIMTNTIAACRNQKKLGDWLQIEDKN